MLRRRDTLLLIGVVLVAVGCTLLFIRFDNEPFWIEWLLGPVLIYLGGPVTIVGAAIHFFAEPANTVASRNGSIAAKLHR